MNREHTEVMATPSLPELLNRFLQRNVDAATAGFGLAQPTGEVVPYEPIPAQPPDPRTAWQDSLAVFEHFGRKVDAKAVTPPSEWSDLIARQEPIMALAFAVGNYPQAVRNLTPLLRQSDLTRLRPTGLSSSQSLSITSAPTADLRSILIAAGSMRLAGQFDTAMELLNHLNPADEAIVANERAALDWHRGNADAAVRSWNAQAVSAPVWFNRGMAALFMGRISDAKSSLGRAVSQLTEDSAWHHLGKLYLAIAEMRLP